VDSWQTKIRARRNNKLASTTSTIDTAIVLRHYLKMLENKTFLESKISAEIDAISDHLNSLVIHVAHLLNLEYFEKIKFEEEDTRLKLWMQRIGGLDALNETEYEILENFLPEVIKHHIELQKRCGIEEERRKIKKELR
jgi:hypothetical protein